MSAVTWLLRIALIRMFGKRAVSILAILGLLGAIRRARSQDVEAVDPSRGRVKLKGDNAWR